MVADPLQAVFPTPLMAGMKSAPLGSQTSGTRPITLAYALFKEPVEGMPGGPLVDHSI